MRKLLIVVLLCMPSQLFAWGEDGHRITAALAFSRLSPQLQNTVMNILAARGKVCLDAARRCPLTLADVSVLPDGYRTREGSAVGRQWHSVRIDVKDREYDAKRDCPFNDCIVGRIERLKALLADKNAMPEERADALIYLAHFIGDIHQPFHCADRTTNGVSDNLANGVHVTITPDVTVPVLMRVDPKLHEVWDSAIIASRQLSVADYTARLKQLLGTQNPSAVIGSMRPAQWANESHRIAIASYVPEGTMLTDAYFARARDIVDERLLKGALRLQRVIEDALSEPAERAAR